MQSQAIFLLGFLFGTDLAAYLCHFAFIMAA